MMITEISVKDADNQIATVQNEINFQNRPIE